MIHVGAIVDGLYPFIASALICTSHDGKSSAIRDEDGTVGEASSTAGLVQNCASHFLLATEPPGRDKLWVLDRLLPRIAALGQYRSKLGGIS